MTALKQPSFAGGEVSPAIYGRSDLAKYQTGMAKVQNFWINRFGNLENRPGTEYGGNTNGNGAARLVPFVVSAAQSYALEIGWKAGLGGYLRVWKGNAPLLVNVASIAAWSAVTGYTNGQIVSSGGSYYVSLYGSTFFPNTNNAVGENTYWHTLTTMVVAGVTYVIIELPMPWTQAYLPLVQWAQINAVMTFASQSHQPVQLKYVSDAEWNVSYNVISNPLGQAGSLTATGTAGAVDYKYMVVPVGPDLTLQGPKVVATGLSMTTATISPNGLAVVTLVAPSSLDVGDPVYIQWNKAAGRTDSDYVVISGSGTNYTIAPYGYTASSGTPIVVALPGIFAPAFCRNSFAIPSVASPNTITWTASPIAAKYNVYRYLNGQFSFIGSTTATTFQDNNITPNPGFQPSVNIPMFSSTNDYPAAVGIYQQRLWFGNTVNQPQSYWASRLGQYGVFSIGTPSNDADAFTFQLAGNQVQFITSFVDIGKLIIHTTVGEYVVNGNQSGGVTPTAQNVVRAGYAGSYPGQMPVVIGNTDLFVQARGSILRDLQYSVQVFNYDGKDTTLFASHLFANRKIVSMAWQQVPNSIVWCILDNGLLVAMTYIKEHSLWAWHQHTTAASGYFESVCVIPEGTNEAVYLIARRSIAGQTVRTFERMWSRDYTDITIDACFTDCSLTYDGRNTGGTTLALSSPGGDWTTQGNLTLTASAAAFASIDVGNIFVLRQLNVDGTLADQVYLSVIAFVSTTVVTVQAQRTVPAWAQVTASISWGKAVKGFSGATQLAGQTISILGDGNAEKNIAVNSSGAFVTSRPYMVVHAGLPVTATAITLDWENTQGETISGKRKIVNELTLLMVNSRGGVYGTTEGQLMSFPQRSTEPYDTPNYLMTGPNRIPIKGTWAANAGVIIRTDDPLPMCLSALVTSGHVGG